MTARAHDRGRRDERPLVQARERAREHAAPSRASTRAGPTPEMRRRDGRDEDDRRRASPTKTRARPRPHAGSDAFRARPTMRDRAAPGRSPSRRPAGPGCGGYADEPDRAIERDDDDGPIPAKRLRGSAFPGSRASAARFATVSSPVKASIASESAKTSVVPGRRRAEVDARAEALPREEERRTRARSGAGARGGRGRRSTIATVYSSRPAHEPDPGHAEDDARRRRRRPTASP